MRFEVDENLPQEVATIFAAAGHDATTVHSQGLCGAPNSKLAAICINEARALFTLDLDFADVRASMKHATEGVIVIRAGVQEREHVIAIVQKIIDVLDRESLRDTLWIVDESSIRVRELDQPHS